MIRTLAKYKIMNPFELYMTFDEYCECQQMHIEKIARTCYKSEEVGMDYETSSRFIRRLIDNGHNAMIEHSMLSVKFITDRGISHETVRHREASFAQESTRYCNYSNDKFGNEITVITPSTSIQYDRKMRNLDDNIIDAILKEWNQAMIDAEKHYMKMLELGASPQIARGVLPTSTKTEIVVTANFREWRHFFKLRAAEETGYAHPQMLELTIPLLKQLQECMPTLFGDIKVREDIEYDS